MQQGSFRFPDNCQDTDCDFLVTYQVSNEDNTKIVFELTGRGQTTKWAGVGFSGDNKMVSKMDPQNCINICTETQIQILHFSVRGLAS